MLNYLLDCYYNHHEPDPVDIRLIRAFRPFMPGLLLSAAPPAPAPGAKTERRALTEKNLASLQIRALNLKGWDVGGWTTQVLASVIDIRVLESLALDVCSNTKGYLRALLKYHDRMPVNLHDLLLTGQGNDDNWTACLISKIERSPNRQDHGGRVALFASELDRLNYPHLKSQAIRIEPPWITLPALAELTNVRQTGTLPQHKENLEQMHLVCRTFDPIGTVLAWQPDWTNGSTALLDFVAMHNIVKQYVHEC